MGSEKQPAVGQDRPDDPDHTVHRGTEIRISKANAQLRRAQGLIANTDFIDDLHYLKVVKVTAYAFPEK